VIDNLLVLRPGLLPVVQTTSVAVEESTGHGIPSITMVFSVRTAEKPVPVNVTWVPPVTVPNLGEMAVSNGVKVPMKLILLATAFSCP